ncbi:MAG: hypothetical protein WCQ50_05255 [Spirochaetota bacterium]
MNNAIAELHLSSSRDGKYRIVWLGFFNDNDIPWHWDRQPWRIAPRGKEHRDTACVHLCIDGLAALRDNMEYERYHWINNGGVLGVHRIEAIAKIVWED